MSYLGLALFSLALGGFLGAQFGIRRERGRLQKFLAIQEAEREAAREGWKARGTVRLTRVKFKKQS